MKRLKQVRVPLRPKPRIRLPKGESRAIAREVDAMLARYADDVRKAALSENAEPPTACRPWA